MNRLLKKAFTLIELLVVIAIIGILSGLIVVSMGGMTDKATIAKAQVFSNSLKNSLMLNLVSEWNFDGDCLDTWGDNDGALAVATYSSSCVYGSCLSFTGALTEYVQIPAINTLTTGKPFIIAAWVYPLGTGNYRAIVGYNNDHRLLITAGGTMLSQQGSNFQSAVGVVPDNKWTHVVYWNSGTEERWYINGALSGTPTSMATAEWNNAFYVGQYDLVNYPYKGKIDEIRIYNATINLSQIKEQYYLGLNGLLINGGINKEDYLSRLNNYASNN